MSVSTEERSLRRRLVYNAMPENLPVDIVQQCIGILENEFGDQPEIKYSQLIKRLNESISVSINGNQMLGQIMVMRRKSAEEIGPDPGSSAVQTGDNLDARGTVFNKMFHSIEGHIQKRGGDAVSKFREQLPTQCKQAGVSAGCEQAILAWSTSGKPSAISCETKDLQTILNQAYVFLCAKFGPIEADKVLHRAINEAEQLPESFEFSPKELM